MKSDEIVLTSRIRLARNISKVPFPHKIPIENGRDLVNKIEDVFYGKDEYDKEFKTVYLWNTDKLAQKAYFERHLISSNMLSNSSKSAFIYNNAETISLMINEEDHIRIQCINSGYDLDKSLVIANEIDDFLEENIDFAFHERYGYLTACPTNIGTALRASVMIHLPVITINHRMESVTNALSQIGMTIRGLYGEGSKAYGNLYQISNQITLGISEEEAVNNLRTVVNQIITQECNAREDVYKNYRYELEDRISRSQGILKSAVLVSATECLKLLSDLRLGCEMDLIKDIDMSTVNDLFIEMQPATIQRKLGKSMTVKEINLARAALIKEKL